MLPTTIGIKTSGALAWLDVAAAASYARMFAAGCPAGGITDSGRTNAEQWDMWWDYRAGKLKATAAYPGTSKHETGNALDLGGATLAWVRAWGATYGWIPDRVANEPWHVEYQAARDTRAHDTAPTSEEDDMAQTLMTAKWKVDGQMYIGDGITRGPLTDQARADLFYQAGQAHVAIYDAGLVDNIAWLGTDVSAPTAAGAGVSLTQVAAAVKTALTTLTLKSV